MRISVDVAEEPGEPTLREVLQPHLTARRATIVCHDPHGPAGGNPHYVIDVYSREAALAVVDCAFGTGAVMAIVHRD